MSPWNGNWTDEYEWAKVNPLTDGDLPEDPTVGVLNQIICGVFERYAFLSKFPADTRDSDATNLEVQYTALANHPSFELTLGDWRAFRWGAWAALQLTTYFNPDMEAYYVQEWVDADEIDRDFYYYDDNAGGQEAYRWGGFKEGDRLDRFEIYRTLQQCIEKLIVWGPSWQCLRAFSNTDYVNRWPLERQLEQRAKKFSTPVFVGGEYDDPEDLQFWRYGITDGHDVLQVWRPDLMYGAMHHSLGWPVSNLAILNAYPSEPFTGRCTLEYHAPGSPYALFKSLDCTMYYDYNSGTYAYDADAFVPSMTRRWVMIGVHAENQKVEIASAGNGYIWVYDPQGMINYDAFGESGQTDQYWEMDVAWWTAKRTRTIHSTSDYGEDGWLAIHDARYMDYSTECQGCAEEEGQFTTTYVGFEREYRVQKAVAHYKANPGHHSNASPNDGDTYIYLGTFPEGAWTKIDRMDPAYRQFKPDVLTCYGKCLPGDLISSHLWNEMRFMLDDLIALKVKTADRDPVYGWDLPSTGHPWMGYYIGDGATGSRVSHTGLPENPTDDDRYDYAHKSFSAALASMVTTNGTSASSAGALSTSGCTEYTLRVRGEWVTFLSWGCSASWSWTRSWLLTGGGTGSLQSAWTKTIHWYAGAGQHESDEQEGESQFSAQGSHLPGQVIFTPYDPTFVNGVPGMTSYQDIGQATTFGLLTISRASGGYDPDYDDADEYNPAATLNAYSTLQQSPATHGWIESPPLGGTGFIAIQTPHHQPTPAPSHREVGWGGAVTFAVIFYPFTKMLDWNPTLSPARQNGVPQTPQPPFLR